MSSSSGTLVANPPTVTPTTASAAIKHVVVIFGENISYDHYFGTYPNALNLAGETAFVAAPGTPSSANYISTPSLLTNNPNKTNASNGTGAVNPFRLAPAQARTADQDHGYTDEQSAFHAGAMDQFPFSVGVADSGSYLTTGTPPPASATGKGLTMGYYDGNTVTAFWNYAQHYSMNDHSFGTNFGPSTDGAVNLISGQTNGVINTVSPGSSVVADGQGGLTMISDADPTGDVCSSTSKSFSMSSKNIGDMLNTAGVTWGWFQGGFDLSVTNADGSTGCSRSSSSPVPPATSAKDYVPHHQPFQYYASTANLNHLRPTSIAKIGQTDQANHQYDIHDFTDALGQGVLPAVSFLKAPAIQNGHAGNSTPLDEQTFVVNIVNALQNSSFWSSTAVVLAYDDSDGWYDHLNNMVNGSATTADTLNGAGLCMNAAAASNALLGVNGKVVGGRCGYGPRLPLLVISPWAKKNYIDSTVTDQTSILKFIEDTFVGGQRIGQGSFDSIAGSINGMFDFSNGAAAPNSAKVLLNPANGTVTTGN